MPASKIASAPGGPKSQPHSLEAEKTLLGAMLLDPDAVIKVMDIVEPGDFYDPVYQQISQAVYELYEDQRPIDFKTVGEKLKRNKKIEEIGGNAFLADLALDVPTASHASYYAELVRDHATRRAYIAAGQKISGLAYDEGKAVDDIREDVERALLGIDQEIGKHPLLGMQQCTSMWHEDYAEVHGLPDSEFDAREITTGFANIDQFLDISPDDLLILAARPAMGKTSLAVNIALHTAFKGKKVGFFSYEMSWKRIMNRIVAGRLGVTVRQLRRGKLTDAQVSTAGDILQDLKERPIYIYDGSDCRLSTMRSKARRLQQEHGVDLIVVDYLQMLFTTEKYAQENKVQMVCQVSSSLKELARELQCPVLSLCQLSRKPDERIDKRPLLADLRESGSIEQDADIVMMLYREGYYNEDCDDPDKVEVLIRKN